MGNRREDLRAEVLSFIEQYIKDNGYPPTYDEIKEAVGLSSKSHAMYYLQALEKEGLIKRTPRSPRGLRLVDMPPTATKVMVGRIWSCALRQPCQTPTQQPSRRRKVAAAGGKVVAFPTREPAAAAG